MRPSSFLQFPTNIRASLRAVLECAAQGSERGVSPREYMQACVTAHMAQQQQRAAALTGEAQGGVFVTRFAALVIVDTFFDKRAVDLIAFTELPQFVRNLEAVAGAHGIEAHALFESLVGGV